MVDAVRSDQPTAVVQVDGPGETLRLVITNVTPSTGRPAVITNYIYRRVSGSSDVWTLAGQTGNNGTVTDLFPRSGASYDYFVRTDTGADSVTYTGTVPTVTGMWAYSTVDYSTITHFPYTDGHSESLDELEQALQFVGRQYPVIEAGIQETQTIAVNVTIPFSDASWATEVEWWRARKRDKQTILYRDGRRRVFAARIVGPVTLGVARQGTVVTCTLQRVDYVANTVTVDPAYYSGGTYNDGGNGIYGNGSQGNGY